MSDSDLDFSGWSLHIFPVRASVLWEYSSLLLLSRFIGNPKQPTGVSALCWPCDKLANCPACNLPSVLRYQNQINEEHHNLFKCVSFTQKTPQASVKTFFFRFWHFHHYFRMEYSKICTKKEK